MVFRLAIFVAAVCAAFLVVAAIAEPSAVTWSDVRTVLGVLLLFAGFGLWNRRLALLRKRQFNSLAEARRAYALSVALPEAVLTTASGVLLFGWVGAVGFLALAASGIIATHRKLFPRRPQPTAPH